MSDFQKNCSQSFCGVEKKRKLRVVALLDGRPGHVKQTQGILQALQELVGVDIREMAVFPQPFWGVLKQLFFLACPGKGLVHPLVEGADLLLGTGSRTHLPLLLYKKSYGIPAITCMSPSPIIRRKFDLCFVPEHDGLEESGNILHTVGAPNCSRNKGRHQDNLGLILLGGIDRKSHIWDSAAIAAMIGDIVAKENSMQWTISSSPRTPVDTVCLMRQLAAAHAHVRFFAYQETQPGWIEDQYNKNSMVWVTTDSISMIYEALTGGCKVGVIPLTWCKKNSKFKRNENLLLQKGLVRSFSSWQQGQATWRENIQLNEAQRCAKRIMQIWPSKN